MTATMAVALPHGSTASLTPFAPNGWAAVGTAAAVLVWGFAGWEAVASLAGDYRDPRRDVPRATGIAVAVVGVLYLGLATTSVLVLGPATGHSQAPLSDLMAIALGEQARVVTAVVAVLLTIGAMNAYFAGGSRLGAALARDGALPRMAGPGRRGRRGAAPQHRSRRRSPRRSRSSSPSCLDLGLTPLMLLATGCFTLVYVLGTASALRLLPRGTVAWWTALVAFVSVAALLVVNGVHALWALGLAVLSLGYRSGARRWEGVPAQAPRLRRRDNDTTRGAHTPDAVVPGRRGDRPRRLLRARAGGQGPAARPAVVAGHVPDRRRLLLHPRLPARHRGAGRRRPVARRDARARAHHALRRAADVPPGRGGEPARRRQPLDARAAAALLAEQDPRALPPRVRRDRLRHHHHPLGRRRDAPTSSRTRTSSRR